VASAGSALSKGSKAELQQGRDAVAGKEFV